MKSLMRAFLARFGHDGRWVECVVTIPRRLIDGTDSGPIRVLMKRRIKGQWQYRLPNTAEDKAMADFQTW